MLSALTSAPDPFLSTVDWVLSILSGQAPVTVDSLPCLASTLSSSRLLMALAGLLGADEAAVALGVAEGEDPASESFEPQAVNPMAATARRVVARTNRRAGRRFMSLITFPVTHVRTHRPSVRPLGLHHSPTMS